MKKLLFIGFFYSQKIFSTILMKDDSIALKTNNGMQKLKTSIIKIANQEVSLEKKVDISYNISTYITYIQNIKMDKLRCQLSMEKDILSKEKLQKEINLCDKKFELMVVNCTILRIKLGKQALIEELSKLQGHSKKKIQDIICEIDTAIEKIKIKKQELIEQNFEFSEQELNLLKAFDFAIEAQDQILQKLQATNDS